MTRLVEKIKKHPEVNQSFRDKIYWEYIHRVTTAKRNNLYINGLIKIKY